MQKSPNPRKCRLARALLQASGEPGQLALNTGRIFKDLRACNRCELASECPAMAAFHNALEKAAGQVLKLERE